MKTLLFASTLALAASSAPAETDGHITLPYSQFVSLTGQSNADPAAGPPVAAVLTHAGFLIEIRDGRALVTVEWQAENFGNEWAAVVVAPLEPAMVPVGDDATLVAGDGGLRLLMPARGGHRAAARFPAPSGLGVAARFPIVPATFNQVRIQSDDAAARYHIDGAATLADADGGLVHLLPTTATEIVVRKSEPDPAPGAPGTWDVDAEAWVAYDAGWLDHEVRLTATAGDGNGGSADMRLDFPDPPAGLVVAADGLLEHETTADGLIVRWDTRPLRERRLVLRYRTRTAGDDAGWQPRLPDAAASTVVLAIPQGAEITGDGWLADPAPARLPAWLREKSGAQPVLLLEGNPVPAIVKWLPRVETDAMTVAEAAISTRVVADGSQLTTASYQIAHAGPGVARWSLPANMQLLNASVAGQRATPVDRGDALEFALPAPAREGQPTTIEFSYTGTGEVLDRVAGGLIVESPSTPLFAHRIDWSIVLPDGNRLDAVESNAEAAPAPAHAPPGAAYLRRLLTRDEPLRAEVFYRSRNSEG